ncbi:T9SS type A sorting domain-containing protein [bacterium]|nr:T9SS type A sorting domain-containing protein [bacterium]
MTDPLLNDPENGDYSLAPDSPAFGYGCQSFTQGKSFLITDKVNKELTPDSRTTLSGVISESILITSLNIQVTGDVFIEDEVILAFLPGATISFNEYYQIDVQGTILAQGNAEARITFTAADPYLFTFDDDLAGSWNGFKFINTKDSNNPSIFSYAIFEYAKAVDSDNTGFTDAGAVFSVYDFDQLRIENSIFRNNYANYGGVLALNKNSNITFINNQVSDNKVALGGSLALISYSNPRIINNTIFNNEVLNQDDFHSTGLIESYISKPIIYNNIIYQNSDNFFMDHQLFSAKAYHTRFNGLDFPFGYNNILLNDLEYEITDNDIYIFTSNADIIDSATLELPFGLELPPTDILGNSRIYDNYLDMGAVEIQPVSNDNNSQAIIKKISLYPNPFNPEITIELPKNNIHGNLTIYNIKGQVVKSFTKITQEKIVWRALDNHNRKVSSGIYFFKYQNKDYSVLEKALLLK